MKNNELISINEIADSARDLAKNMEKGIKTIGDTTEARESIVRNMVVSEEGLEQKDGFKNRINELKLQYHTTFYGRYEMD